MILSCPECSTRFVVNEALLEPHGRKVKCAKCAHVWFQEPNRIDGEPVTVTPIDDIPHSVRPIPEGSGLPVPTYDWSFSIARFVMLFIIFTLIAAGTLIALRDRVVHAWEPSARIFEMIGLNVLTEGHGIAIEDVKVIESTVDGKKMITVSGFLRNTTEVNRNVPNLMVRIEGSETEEFIFEPPVDVLSLGQSSKFKYDHETSLVDGESATVRFILDKKKKEKHVDEVTAEEPEAKHEEAVEPKTDEHQEEVTTDPHE